MSLREVARRAGVTHPAALYHFGDKAGLLTAVALEGYQLVGAALREALEATGSYLEVGVAYVRFAVTHRAHFEVMYRPELYDQTNQTSCRPSRKRRPSTAPTLRTSQLGQGVAAWALVHGIATLWLNGNLPSELGDDPELITRMIAPYLSIPASLAVLPQRRQNGYPP